MLNKFIATGRLVKDPEVRYSQENSAIARFSLAIDKMDKEHSTGYINCVAFGRNAEFVEKYISKGMKIEFDGHVSPGPYTNKEGIKVYTTDFIAERLDFAEKKAQGNNKTSVNANASSDTSVDGFVKIPEDIENELPFE